MFQTNISKKFLGGLITRVILMALFFCLASLSLSYAGPFGPRTFPGIRIKGTVVDSLTKQAIPNATVSVYNSKGTLLASTKTDSKGYYRISLLTGITPPLSIQAQAPGYQLQTRSGSLSPYREYTINFSLTLKINRSPSIASIRLRTIRENQRLIFRIYAYDPDKDPLTYSAINLPQGAVFDQKTRIFSWTPAYGQAGTYNITFEANDGKLTASKTITIIIRNGDTNPPAGSLTINNNAKYTNSLSVTVNLTAQDNPGGSGLNEMQFSTDNKTWSSPEAFTSTKTLNLASGDGPKTVSVKFSDNKGNWSSPTSSTIILDTIPPRIIITSPKEGEVLTEPEVSLQGTIDGQAFTETRTLTDNQSNTLTKTATDAAGNTSSAEVTVFYYTGGLIGPDGGEVTSPDGKVRLVIPAGALIKQVRVLVVLKDSSALQEIIPAEKSLFKIVECRPQGLPLVKDKPAQLIYTLDQAEVPGTPVELGLYDSIQEVITYQGTSYVASDSYTVSFPITHFSVYASLKTTEQKPIGAGVKIPLPDMLTGSFSSSIPITTPPGRKGIQPSLSLTYRSSNPNSWTGVGFSLNPGYIVRSTRLGPPTYDDTKDTFYFITDAGTTELVYLIDNLYQAKVESSFSKFYKEKDDSWKVVSKDGSILIFGQTKDSKETSDSGTFSWYITEAIDTNGNYLEFHYTKDQGKSYLSRIDYTGNKSGTPPTNSVEFFRQSRQDLISSYISGSKIETNQLLKEIQVKLNSELVWTYELEYEPSQDTNRSLLKSVTQSGSDGKSLPVQRFSYQKAK